MFERGYLLPEGAPPLGQPPPQNRRAPIPVALRREDFEARGNTDGCSKCARIYTGHSGQGYSHSVACRFRLEKKLEEADDHRLAAARRRYF